MKPTHPHILAHAHTPQPQTVDIQTCKKEDLAFATDFVLTAEHNDYGHAFVVWFDIEFSHCHKPVYFGTGPQHRYTHWKQAVFYIEDHFCVSAGEQIRGRFACKVCALVVVGWEMNAQHWHISLIHSETLLSALGPHNLVLSTCRTRRFALVVGYRSGHDAAKDVTGCPMLVATSHSRFPVCFSLRTAQREEQPRPGLRDWLQPHRQDLHHPGPERVHYAMNALAAIRGPTGVWAAIPVYVPLKLSTCSCGGG